MKTPISKKKPAPKKPAKRQAGAKTAKAAKKQATKTKPVKTKTAKPVRQKLQTPQIPQILKEKKSKGRVAGFVLESREALCRRAIQMDLTDIDKCFLSVCAAPTGSGKTQAARLLGMRIVNRLGHDRVVVASPYVVLCRQTEEDWKAAIDPETVMRATHDMNYASKAQKRKAKAFQFPVNIVSMEALLQALSRPNSAKAHSLRKAVVILDDPDQTIPTHAMRFFLHRCRDFHKLHGTHFILTSATFPKLWEVDGFEDEVAKLDLPKRLEEKLKDRYRTGFSRTIGSIDTLAAEVLACEQKPTMVVLNTKRNAKNLLKKILIMQKLLPEKHPQKVTRAFFITTDIHPARRRAQEKAAEKAVDAKERVIIIGTSCIQAGWDISCGTIFRENAGFIPQHQIGGRTNRNGELKCGVLIIFQLADGTKLAEARIPAEILLQAYLEGRAMTATEAVLAHLECDPEVAQKESKLGRLWKNYKKTGLGLPEIERLLRFTYYRKKTIMTAKSAWAKKDLEAMDNGRWSIKILRKYQIQVSDQDIKTMRVLLSGELALVLDPEELDLFERIALEGEDSAGGFPFLSEESYHKLYGIKGD